MCPMRPILTLFELRPSDYEQLEVCARFPSCFCTRQDARGHHRLRPRRFAQVCALPSGTDSPEGVAQCGTHLFQDTLRLSFAVPFDSFGVVVLTAAAGRRGGSGAAGRRIAPVWRADRPYATAAAVSLRLQSRRKGESLNQPAEPEFCRFSVVFRHHL